MFSRVLITGGAGFVGSSLARLIKQEFSSCEVYVLDNLKRRGSELNLKEFKDKHIHFVHGDIRNREDLDSLSGEFDLMLECSAEPSVHSGVNGGLKYLIDTNLGGTLNCLDFARNRVKKTIFLSTSRVYSIPMLKKIPLKTENFRFKIDNDLLVKIKKLANTVIDEGITEDFDVMEFRSFYGATKLCSEIFIKEYAENFGTNVLVNRCGVIAGPGQFGKVDQGVFTLWVANHFYKKSLKYFGYGGKGVQVRDLLHPVDLFELLKKQYQAESWNGEFYNVGGGIKCSTSLAEYTELCEQATGNSISIDSVDEVSKLDVPYYVTCNKKVSETFGWKPQKKTSDIVKDIYSWIYSNEEELRNIFC